MFPSSASADLLAFQQTVAPGRHEAVRRVVEVPSRLKADLLARQWTVTVLRPVRLTGV